MTAVVPHTTHRPQLGDTAASSRRNMAARLRGQRQETAQ